ncbi:MAG: hypothetical protein PWQ17_2574 [Anaerophaga sp.]|jgi:hypothetical protein|nr:hypothetical protein [Anaerophaga sp.]
MTQSFYYKKVVVYFIRFYHEFNDNSQFVYM